MSDKKECPCYSGEPYTFCCQPFHEGKKFPQTAEQLMRSRYAAYSLSLTNYIMDTTHPDSPYYQLNRVKWRSEIKEFSNNTVFTGLTILQKTEDTVTFHAQLEQNGQDASFLEQSKFGLVNGRWMYIRPI